MCGIVGLFAKSPEIEERLGEHLSAMLVQMSSRGPDSAGVAVYRDPVPAGSSKLTLYSADAHEHCGAVMDALRDEFGSCEEPSIKEEGHNWICRRCGQEVVSKGRPEPLRWDDGHVCRFSPREEEA